MTVLVHLLSLPQPVLDAAALAVVLAAAVWAWRRAGRAG